MSIEKILQDLTAAIVDQTKAMREATEAGEKLRLAYKEAVDSTARAVDVSQPAPTEKPAKKGPFYWHHPESCCVGQVKTAKELDALLGSDGNTVEIDEATFKKLQAEYKPAPKETAVTQATEAKKPAPETSEPAESTETAETTSAASDAELTYEMVKDKMQALMADKGAKAVKKILDALGRERVPHIEFDQFADAIRMADEALAS